jgi:cytochrome b561
VDERAGDWDQCRLNPDCAINRREDICPPVVFPAFSNKAVEHSAWNFHMNNTPKGYSRLQITLHWVSAVLVIAAFVTHDAMIAAVKAVKDGTWGGYDPAMLIHIAGGSLVFFLALWRLQVLAKRGVPPLPKDEPPMLAIISKIIKALLYLIVLVMPLSGVLNWFGGGSLARQLHVLMEPVVPLAILLHLLGALYQQFLLKSGVLARMLRPEMKG